MKSKYQAAKLTGFCPRYRRAVETIGRRWSGAIIRALLPGPRRFGELASAVPGLSDRLLSARLRELERLRIVRRSVRAGPPVRIEYALTESGKELQTVVRAIAHWAQRRIPVKAARPI